jgi:hypothetical protein
MDWARLYSNGVATIRADSGPDVVLDNLYLYGFGTGEGGAVRQTGGTLTVSDSFLDGRVTSAGGALWLRDVDAVIEGSRVQGAAYDELDDGAGGAVFATGGSLTIVGTEVTEGLAASGAAIYADGDLLMDGCDIHESDAERPGGGGGYGALYVAGNATLVDTQIYENNGNFLVSAVVVDTGGSVTLECTDGGGVFDNSAGYTAWVRGALVSESCDWSGNMSGIEVEDVGEYEYDGEEESFTCVGGLGCQD